MFAVAMTKKPPPSAVTPQGLAAAASRKTRRVQRKLHDAESDLHQANEMLAHAAPQEAAERNAAAERKVREAAEELEVVKEMLEHADTNGAEPRAEEHKGGPKSGHGVKSLLAHLKPKT